VNGLVLAEPPLRRCWISLGSNRAREASIRGGVQQLRAAFGALVLSPVYETEAEGFDGDPFLNLVAGVKTGLGVGEIRAILRRIEAAHGRERGDERFAPRTLDLDLLTFGSEVGEIDGYQVPRDEILRYAFVLGPLADVAPHELHPTAGLSYERLWRQLLQRLREQRRAQRNARLAPTVTHADARSSAQAGAPSGAQAHVHSDAQSSAASEARSRAALQQGPDAGEPVEHWSPLRPFVLDLDGPGADEDAESP
jgi:2-amino-4-hydroxy-6-hydroxymethyldihydropteridine diphosphokinase